MGDVNDYTAFYICRVSMLDTCHQMFDVVPQAGEGAAPLLKRRLRTILTLAAVSFVFFCPSQIAFVVRSPQTIEPF